MAKIRGIQFASEENTINQLLNGNFDIWQRGTSFANPVVATGYTADRWVPFQSNGSVTVSRQTAGLDGSSFCMRVNSDAASAFRGMTQVLHSSTANLLQGKYVTFSIYLRRNASLTVPMVISIDKNSTPNTASGGIWNNVNNVVISNSDIGTSGWTRFQVTGLIPNDGTALGIRICVNVALGTTASGAYFEMAQAMLNIGQVAARFRPATDSVGDEGEACKYFYEQKFTTSAGWIQTVSTMHAHVTFVRKRVNPTISAAGTLTTTYGPGGSQTCTFNSAVLNSTDEALFQVSNAGGMTIGAAGNFNGPLAIDAELT